MLEWSGMAFSCVGCRTKHGAGLAAWWHCPAPQGNPDFQDGGGTNENA